MESKTQLPVIFLLSFIVLLATVVPVEAQESRISGLKVEYLKDPVGIDMQHPRFSWIINSRQRGIKQSAYQILVASSREKLAENQADLWDSGKTQSNRSINVAYDGKELQSDRSYYWKVKAWNQNGTESSWSSMGKFHTGLLHKSDWQGDWISTQDTTISAPRIRKEFNTHKKVKEAYAFVVGLGYHELYINGQKVGDHKLDPGTTNYNKRALYVSYNITDYLNEGKNVVGVWLGNGYLRHRTTKHYASQPQLLVQVNIKYNDGTSTSIVSNLSWKTSDSPITANSIYDGEIYDARKEQPGWSVPSFDDSGWKQAAEINVPKNRTLDAQLMPPIRVTKTIKPVSMTEPQKGVYVFDFGQNMTGWPRLHVRGGEGNKVTLKTAEITQSDMARMKQKPFTGDVDTINTSPNRSAKARDIYILKGSTQKETYEPRFTYHGFRYVQVEGFPGKPTLRSLEARVVHSNVQPVGSFKSSNSLLNQIHNITQWGQLSNLFSMPTDCPQRDERQGWMGDAHLTAVEAMHNFDMAAFYTKWLQDIQVSQNDDGSVPDVVPQHKYNSTGTPAWQVAYPLIVWYMHEYYSDNRIIKQHYNSLKKWIDYMDSIADNHIITKGRGDWVPPRLAYEPDDQSIPITSTVYYYKCAQIMSKMAGILNKPDEKQQYDQLASQIKTGFNQKYWKASEGNYGTGSQTSNVFPLYGKLVAENDESEVVQNLVNNIRGSHDGHIDTGILGTKALVEVLPKYKKSNVLYEMATKTTFPSWGYMLATGSTTLWERWGGYRYFDADMNSLNHIMFGSIDEFFYKNLAGIQQAAPGFKSIVIRPSADIAGKKLNQAQASIKTIRGTVASKWEFGGNAVTMNVTIPGNSTAKVSIPKGDLVGPFVVKEDGLDIFKNGQLQQKIGIHSAQESEDYITFEVGSGSYAFKLMGH